LPVGPGENFYFGPDRALIVGQALEIEFEPVIFVTAFVAQENRWAVILRDHKIGSAVAVVVAGDDGAGIFESNFVKADIGGYVFPTIPAQVAEYADFAFAIFSFADCNQVNPAIVVIVESSHAKSPHPIRFGKLDRFKTLASF